ncbi:hypothetical protein JXA47_13415 [Candidatus Sumerlaeota bacterium]|nr:hypothetical protein [Candidatus Sumerlaeota bacterium]
MKKTVRNPGNHLHLLITLGVLLALMSVPAVMAQDTEEIEAIAEEAARQAVYDAAYAAAMAEISGETVEDETAVSAEEAYSDGYADGYEDGYAEAVAQAYEAELRALYAEREALAASNAAQSQIDQADAELVAALLAIESDYQAMYFEALSDLEDQNEAYWAALEAAVYDAPTAYQTEVVYTYAGVPAYCAPYAGYWANGVYVPYGSANWVVPRAPVTTVEIDDIVTEINVHHHEDDLAELRRRAEQHRRAQEDRPYNLSQRAPWEEPPGNGVPNPEALQRRLPEDQRGTLPNTDDGQPPRRRGIEELRDRNPQGQPGIHQPLTDHPQGQPALSTPRTTNATPHPSQGIQRPQQSRIGSQPGLGTSTRMNQRSSAPGGRSGGSRGGRR